MGIVALIIVGLFLLSVLAVVLVFVARTTSKPQ